MSGNFSKSGVIYFDNAATSFPKPKEVGEAILDYLQNIGANPGRSGHRKAVEAGQIVFRTRKLLADFFGLANPMYVIFTSNATEALNTAIRGILRNGDHVITSSMEHNSTIRPLHQMKKFGQIELTIVPSEYLGMLDPDDIKKAIRKETKAIVINHVSNVNGCVQNINEIGDICKKNDIIFIVDAAQSAGVIPIDFKKDNIDLLAIPGHKGLYGPTGTGALLINDDFEIAKIKPLKCGGTGSLSDSIEQPDFLPDMLESGTLNVAGIAGLKAGIEHIQQFGLEKIQEHKKQLQDHFIHKAAENIPDFKHFTNPDSPAVGVISFILKGKSVSEIAQILSEKYRIMCRQGLHCAPLAHQTLGTYPQGTIRFGFSIFNTIEEIDFAVNALREIANE
ncbi:MAG: aminotransferase class V-fold PLP-dependent enzyme [Candidatus Cloacimonetes bacterium]|nr:aminotransferase class V-fold PLP-dependent enzyme [Candidatus Cloacimonadota bacterium]MCF7815094.1 aminotransferase class V-fold PLP-dependent enzyme [Candidatus Cloacimonadota bacterium]MCF7869318.1 aminotransferase class V-fold PLP-dependent enzyme [Candidatus Cloacimonadota bacterium]MCF7884730.1 aminotransferase class V-fold PLP-dependent enzyme [Candidatus Cloacimonadota bacterium]